jgi:hypothetical protein
MKEQKACELCKRQNGSGCTQEGYPDPNHWICKAWLAKAAQSSEPQELREQAITKILEKWFRDPIDKPCAYCEAVKEILSLIQQSTQANIDRLQRINEFQSKLIAIYEKEVSLAKEKIDRQEERNKILEWGNSFFENWGSLHKK